jgi:serine protease inhibitor
MKKTFAFISLCLLVFIASCNKPNASVPDQTKTIILPTDGDAIINANNKFAFNFFRATLKQYSVNNNKLVYPLSFYFDLSMVYNGADNAT